VKGPLIKSKAGQYSWLQVLALVISGIAYVTGSMTVAIVMLAVATILGVASMIFRLREARQQMGNQPVQRRRQRQ
jgi:hypothetical protein